MKIVYARRPSVILPDRSENGDGMPAGVGNDGAHETASWTPNARPLPAGMGRYRLSDGKTEKAAEPRWKAINTDNGDHGNAVIPDSVGTVFPCPSLRAEWCTCACVNREGMKHHARCLHPTGTCTDAAPDPAEPRNRWESGNVHVTSGRYIPPICLALQCPL